MVLECDHGRGMRPWSGNVIASFPGHVGGEKAVFSPPMRPGNEARNVSVTVVCEFGSYLPSRYHSSRQHKRWTRFP